MKEGRGHDREALIAWLEYVAQYAIDWLDELRSADEDREDDELGDDDALPLARRA